LPLSAKEVWSKLPSPKSDLVSIYRILTRFVKEGIVSRVEFGDGTTRYELKRSHHHHARCSACHHVEDIALCVKDMEKKVCRKSGFQIMFHEIQMTGLCKTCAKRAARPAHRLPHAAVTR
jgi:Fur family ferric uptake transcriptional regulator